MVYSALSNQINIFFNLIEWYKAWTPYFFLFTLTIHFAAKLLIPHEAANCMKFRNSSSQNPNLKGFGNFLLLTYVAVFNKIILFSYE